MVNGGAAARKALFFIAHLTLTFQVISFEPSEEDRPKVAKRNLLESKPLRFFPNKEEALVSHTRENQGAYDQRHS